MYCVKCGVELADSEKKCPLCGTVVYHLDIKQAEVPGTFPKTVIEHEVFNRQGILFILTILFILPLILTFVCDISLNHTITWSGYTMSSIALGYIVFVLPLWFRSPNPVIFVPVDFTAIGLLLLYINYTTGGSWFLTFALPVIVILAVIVTTVITLSKYLKRGKLFIYGGAFLALGALMMLIEHLTDITFGFDKSFVWSPYPLIVFALLGFSMIIIRIVKPFRESLRRKFFL